MQFQAEPVSSLTVNNLALATERVVIATALPPAPGIANPPTESGTSGNVPMATGTTQQAPASQPTTSPIGPPLSTTSVVEPGNTQSSSSLGASATSAAGTQAQPSTTAQTTTTSVSGAASEPPPPVPSSFSSSSSSTSPSFPQITTAEYELGPSGSAPPPPPPAQSTWTPSTTSSWASTTSSWVQSSSSGPPPESTWTNTWVAAAVATSASSASSAAGPFADHSTAGSASSSTSVDHLSSHSLLASAVPTTFRGFATNLVTASTGFPNSGSGRNATSAGAEGGEDEATSSTKGGMNGGVVAGVIIALLVLLGVGWVLWIRKKRKAVNGSENEPFWNRFFGRTEYADPLQEKRYDRQQDDAVAFGDVLSNRDEKKSKSSNDEDAASSFYIPSKSTKPIESQYFGSGDSPLEPPRRISGGYGLRSDQSSWLGPPPGAQAVAPSQNQPHSYPQPSMAYGPPPVPVMPSYHAAQSQPSIPVGRQSIAPGGYGHRVAYDTPSNEVLRDEPMTTNGGPQTGRESLSSYYSSSDAETMADKKRSVIDSIYSTWGNASSVGGGGQSAVSSAYLPFSDNRRSRMPQRKSTLKKSWKPQSRALSADSSLGHQSGRGRDELPPQNPPPQVALPRKPMAAMASTPVAVKNNVGFGAGDAPPMPLGWGNHRA